MRLGMTLGLIGGVIALLFGLVLALIGGAVGGAASQLGASGTVAKSALLTLVSIGLPVAAIVGSVMLPKNLNLGLLCMAVPAVVLVLFGATQGIWLFAILGALIGAGAYFGWADKSAPPAQEGQ